MQNGFSHKQSRLTVGDTVFISKTIINKYGLGDCPYLVISTNQHMEAFANVFISDSGTLFFFADYEVV